MNILSEFFFWGNGLMAAAAPLSIALVSLTFFPLVSVWFLGGRWTFRRWPARWGITEKAFALFFFVSAISALLGMRPLHSLHEILKDLYLFISILLVATVDSKEKARRLLGLFIAAGLVAAAWGAFQYLSGADKSDVHYGQILAVPHFMAHWPRQLILEFSTVNGRAHGTRSHPITYGESLLFVLAFTMSYLTERQEKNNGRKSAGWFFGSVLTGAALLGSKSRGPWIAAAAMGAALLAIRRSARAWAWGALVAVPCLMLLATPAMRHRLESIGDQKFVSNSERLEMWHAAWDLWKKNPFFGIGPGNSKPMSLQYMTAKEQVGGGWGHFHSNFMNILAERGAVGLAGFFLYFGTMLIEVARAYRDGRTTEEKSIQLAAFVSVLAFLLSGLTETSYNDTKILMMLYFVTGIAFAWSRRLSSTE
jgi:O-antigen ligase